MRSTHSRSSHTEGEHRLIFLDAPQRNEAQVPQNEKIEAAEQGLDTIHLQSTELKAVEAAATQATDNADKKIQKFDADLKKTENADGSTTVDLNLKLTIPGAEKLVDVFQKFTSARKESAPAEESTDNTVAAVQNEPRPAEEVNAPPLEEEIAEEITAPDSLEDTSVEDQNSPQATPLNDPESTTNTSEEPSGKQEATEDSPDRTRDLMKAQQEQIQKQQEQIKNLQEQLQTQQKLLEQQQQQIARLIATLEANQARTNAPAATPAQGAPDTAKNRTPLVGRSPDMSASTNTPEANNATSRAPEQRERNLTPREALVQSARDAMGNDPSLASDMSRLYDYFETNQNTLPATYEAMEDTAPDMYYTMALASAKINKFAFDISKLDPKVVSEGRRSIQSNPQGTFDFMKAAMMSGGSGVSRAPNVVSDAVRKKATESGPASSEQKTTLRSPDTAAPAPDAQTPSTKEAPATAATEPEEEKKGLDAQAVEGLKAALGTLANTVKTQPDGNATIDLSSVSDNPLATQGIGIVLDSLSIKHENGKIAVTKENIAALTAAAAKLVDLVSKVSSGNLADLPPDVSQKMLDAIDKQLPENMRGKLKLENANIVLDAGDALDKPLARLALKAAKLEVKDGKITIKPQDIAKVVAALTALSRFFPKRQEA